MARSGVSASSSVRALEADYRDIEQAYRDLLDETYPPADLAWEPVRVGPSWGYDNGWVLPERTLGWRNLAWATRHLRAKTGGNWWYTPEQARFILWFYALNEDGTFAFNSAVLQRLKGWGKDPLAACLSMTALCSDAVTFDHWDGDRPVGREEPEAWVQLVAVAEKQTQNTMKLFPSLVPAETRRRYGVQIGKLNVWAMGDSRQIEAITSNPLTVEGGRPTLVVRNEPQNWNSSNSGHAMAGAIEGNAAKSARGAARILDICNAFRPGEDSVGERTREAFEATIGSRCAVHAAVEGWPACDDCVRPRSADFGLLYDSLEAPPEAPLSADAAPSVVEAIRGDSVWLDTKRIVSSILNPSNPASESRRKWYNQITATEDAWADPNHVKTAERDDQLADGDTVVLFGDGSKSDDATGLVAVRVSDGFGQVLHVQQPKAGQIVDRDAVDHAVIRAFDRLSVVAFWFDPSHVKDDDAEGDNRFWWPLVDEWAQRYGRRLKCHPVRSGNRAHAVAFDMAVRSNVQTFVQACEQVAGEFEQGQVAFARSAWLVDHLTNARRSPGQFGVGIRKENRESRHKIDLAVCLIGARMLRRIYQLSTKNGTPGKGRVVALD